MFVHIWTYTTDSMKAVFSCFVLNLGKMDLFSCLETINGNVACGVRNPKRRTVLYTVTYSLSRKEKVVIYK